MLSRGINIDAHQPSATPNKKPSPTSWSTKRHHTKFEDSVERAAKKVSTAGKASPSLRPDSKLSECLIRRGTRGLVTMLEVNTGSVGESKAPNKSDSVQVKPTIR